MKGIVFLAVVAATLCVGAAPARANLLFEVNNAGDRPDDDPNGICDVAPNVDGDQCSLRGAIQETNAIPGSDGIDFAIPGRGVRRITPDSQLPIITGPVEINGYTQPGASPNTNDLAHADNAVLKIELSGEDLPAPHETQSGLRTGGAASGTVISGLIINRFHIAVYLDHPGLATVVGNFIGTDASGTLGRGNDFIGIADVRPDAQMGGIHPADRNVIAAGGYGIYSGPFFGMNTDPRARIQGNFIGTQADGVSPLGNQYDGIDVNATHALVGGLRGANVVAFNQGDGIFVGGTACRLSRNRIFDNGYLAIDLYNKAHYQEITPNDQLDADTGSNDLQNFPLLMKAVTGPKATTIQGALASVPNETFTIEFFAGPGGSGREGRRFIGEKTVSSDEDGFSNFGFRPFKRVPVGQAITATATNSNGSTSEFSAPRVVKQP
jgi:hypothetical protein